MSDQRGVERPFDGRRDEADGMVLHEERLTPGVERYEVGRVEVRKRIIVEELTVTLPVRREVADLVRVYDDGSEEVLDLPPSYWEPRIEDRTGGMPYGSKETPAGAYGEEGSHRSVADITADNGASTPGTVSFVAAQAQFTPKTVETASERQKLMFRVRAQIPPELLQQYIEQVKTGVPGVAWVKLDPDAAWPASLATVVAQD